ncbi:MAG: T9SS type A sorting domain-containing protein [Bacteroidota bacterium]
MKNSLLFIALLVISGFACAQKTDENFTPIQYKTSTCKSSFPKIKLERENNAASVEKFLRKSIGSLTGEQVDLKLNYVNESPGGFHYSFTQTFIGIRIYQSEIKVNVDRKNIVRSIFDNSENTSEWNLNIVNAGENSVIAIHPETNLPVITEKKIENQYFETLRMNGEIIFQHDLRAYFGVTDSLVRGSIFNPDPLTSSQQPYGAPYADDSNRTSALFDAQMDTVIFKAKFDSTLSLFKLESDYVRVRDFGAPVIPIATSSLPEFYFDRSQSGFEDVNAFYHISAMQNHIHSLGFNCADGLVEIDPHGYGASDQSIFNPGIFPMQIVFGDGGVDDAEDADVCVHEYAHFVSESASPGSNYGQQRNAVDEGFGDYIAASYSNSINPHNNFQIFNWDGHNEFWNGRVMNTGNVYDTSLNRSIYRNGEIWSSALYAIHNEIGKLVTDSLIFETHYNYAQEISMRDAAQILIDADTTLFNGNYFCIIYKHLLVRNLVDFNPAYLSCLTDVVNLEELNVHFFQNGNSFTLLNSNEAKLQLQILNINGQLVSGTAINQTAYHHEDKSLPGGIYLVVLQSKNAVKTFKWSKAK